MKTSLMVVIATVLTAAPLFAQQESSASDQATRGYVTAVGGLAYFSNITNFGTPGSQGTSQLEGDAGFRIASHVMVFGNGGWMRNFQKALQPVLVNTTTSVYASHTISTTGGGSVRALYGMGGLNLGGPTLGQITPYVLGGVGVARLNPKAHFTYNSGTIPGQTTAPGAGSDVTAALTKAGYFTPPLNSMPMLFMVGGGARMAVAKRGVIDASYRYSRIAADAALSAPAQTFNGLTFGFGARF